MYGRSPAATAGELGCTSSTRHACSSGALTGSKRIVAPSAPGPPQPVCGVSTTSRSLIVLTENSRSVSGRPTLPRIVSMNPPAACDGALSSCSSAAPFATTMKSKNGSSPAACAGESACTLITR